MPDIAPELPPAGIRLIRETRQESRKEFAEVVGVTRATVGSWERGVRPPSDVHRVAIVDAIPEDLTLENVLTAEDRPDD
ncbi:helix-turn-helix transcriptional regulator [Halolamina sp. C58]|uniref:helix-turn-helix transcriptional regulator n=1 Tax=Halolamina sp. C58 TaxID=3421640 RepID=UPI003EB8B69C